MSHWIKLEDHFEPNVLALAHQAASNCVYTRRYAEGYLLGDPDEEDNDQPKTTSPSETEEEPGINEIWHVSGERFYDGLFDENYKELTIENSSAYDLLKTCFRKNNHKRPADLYVDDDQFTLPDKLNSNEFIEAFGSYDIIDDGTTAEQLVCAVEHKFSILDLFGAEALALAEKAAPGSWYTRRFETWDAEFDDDAGWYVSVNRSYAGLYGRDRSKLTVQDPVAYEGLGEYFQPEDDDEYGDDLGSNDSYLRLHMDGDDLIRHFGNEAIGLVEQFEEDTGIDTRDW